MVALTCRAGASLVKCEYRLTSVLEVGSYASYEPPLVTGLTF